MNANNIARIANMTRIANNINTNTISINTINNTSAVKEDTSMKIKTIARSARRAAASLLALGGLLTLSRTAKADIVVDKFNGPQGTYSYDAGQLIAPAGVTALQLKIRNTDNTTVSGITVQTYVYLASDVNNGWTVRAMPLLTNQTLGPNQSKWVTLAIPQMSRQGSLLYNQLLWAKAIVTNKEYWVQNVLDRPADNIQLGVPQHTSGTNTFTITFTNNGTQESLAKQVTVVATPSNNDGPVAPSAPPQIRTLPGLSVKNQGSNKPVSYTLTFTMPANSTDSNYYAQFCALDITIADPIYSVPHIPSQVNY